MSDTLDNGRRIRVLTVVDHSSRVSPIAEGDVPLSGSRVVEALEQAIAVYVWPKFLYVDNGPGFSGQVLNPGALWA